MADFFKIGQAAYGGGAAASKAIGEGLQKSQQIFMDYLSGQKAKREKADNITKQYLAQIPNVNAITKIPEWMRADVNNYLVSEKQKYAEVSKRLGSMSSSDPTYMDAINELQDIKNNFAYLNDQLNQFQEDSKQYALAADNDKISEGFKLGQADKFNRTAAMYTGNAKLNIQNGNLFFNVDGKDYNYSRGEIGDYSPKNFDAQVELVNLEEQIGNDALRGRTFDSVKSKYKGKITTFLKKNGKEGALSMVFDTDPEFITGGPSLQTPEILTAIAEDNFEGKTDENGNQIPGVYDLIEDQIMTGASTVHASIYKPPSPPPPTENQFGQGLRDDLLTSNYLFLEAKQFGKEESKNVKPEQREQKSKQLVRRLKQVMPLENRDKLATRGEMYNLFLENKKSENKNIKDNKELRDEFTRLYGDSQLYYDSEAIEKNTDNEFDLSDLYLDLADLSTDARNYFKTQLRTKPALPTK